MYYVKQNSLAVQIFGFLKGDLATFYTYSNLVIAFNSLLSPKPWFNM